MMRYGQSTPSILVANIWYICVIACSLCFEKFGCRNSRWGFEDAATEDSGGSSNWTLAFSTCSKNANTCQPVSLWEIPVEARTIGLSWAQPVNIDQLIFGFLDQGRVVALRTFHCLWPPVSDTSFLSLDRGRKGLKNWARPIRRINKDIWTQQGNSMEVGLRRSCGRPSVKQLTEPRWKQNVSVQKWAEFGSVFWMDDFFQDNPRHENRGRR